MIGRKLDRHVLRSFLGPYLASLAGLAALLVLFDLFERIDECFQLIARPDGSTGEALKTIGVYYAVRAGAFVAGYGGLACLAGAALTVAVLHRNSEVTAMRAAGISARRALAPLLMAAAAAGLLQLAATEYLLRPRAPRAEEAMNAIYRRKPRTGALNVQRWGRVTILQELADGVETVWQGRAELQFSARGVAPSGRTTGQLSVDITPRVLAADGQSLRFFVIAETARWSGRDWLLSGGQFVDHSADPARRDCSRIACEVSPYALEAEALGLAGLSLDELIEIRNDAEPRIELWRRLCLPLLNVVMLLIGLPLAVKGSSRGGRLLPLGMALVLGALYVLAVEMGAHVASGGDLLGLLRPAGDTALVVALGGPLRLSIDLAMTIPHVLFLAAGTMLYWKVDS
jgi:lipopolysaccharide export LptBFGC system permease protein LptF